MITLEFKDDKEFKNFVRPFCSGNFQQWVYDYDQDYKTARCKLVKFFFVRGNHGLEDSYFEFTFENNGKQEKAERIPLKVIFNYSDTVFKALEKKEVSEVKSGYPFDKGVK